MFDEEGFTLPATRRVAIVNAGAGGGGGYSNVLKLAREGKRDRTSGSGSSLMETHAAKPNNSCRLTMGWQTLWCGSRTGYAIEAAIIDGIPDDVLRGTISDIATAAGLPGPHNLASLSGTPLGKEAIQFIKSNSLHGQFVDTLPSGFLPVLGCSYLKKLIQAATGNDAGLVQL